VEVAAHFFSPRKGRRFCRRKINYVYIFIFYQHRGRGKWLSSLIFWEKKKRIHLHAYTGLAGCFDEILRVPQHNEKPEINNKRKSRTLCIGGYLVDFISPARINMSWININTRARSLTRRQMTHQRPHNLYANDAKFINQHEKMIVKERYTSVKVPINCKRREMWKTALDFKILLFRIQCGLNTYKFF